MVKEGSVSSAPQSKLIWLIAPKTGDKADILPWILLMTCFVGGMTGGWVLYRRKSKKKK
jgi:LPXTG-motif cell wall-anchored protein